ncbi:MAG: hypothetical protein AMXMBFR53_31140 [Gemmatimonadota bacterium]
MKCLVTAWTLVVLVLSAGCGTERARTSGLWEGQVDTLASGRIVAHNAGHGVWAEGEAWVVEEDLRLGSIEDKGPTNFGRIASFAVDRRGWIWILDSQAKELRVFDAEGEFVRTIGRSGQGPGEFEQPVRVDIGPDGNAWVMDPRNTRLSVFDSAGRYVKGLPVPGGFVIIPWEGGFDERGDYYAPVASMEPEFRISLGRFDREYTPLDTIELPRDPVAREGFEIVSDGRVRVRAGVPFQGGLLRRLSRKGTVWALVTDQYRLIELGPEGDTLAVVTKTHEPIPVTAAERAEAVDGLSWFTEQGGKVDASKIPQEKPIAASFFVDEGGFLWVELEGEEGISERAFDLFNPGGQYLGKVLVPFQLQASPTPLVRGNALYGVVRDEFDVPYLVRARLTRQKANPS